MDLSTGTLLASSSSKAAVEGDLQNPIVTISQRIEAMSMLAPNITIEYRGPVPTFSTPFQPPVRINVLQNESQYVNAQVEQHTPQFSVRILPTHPSSQDFDWLEMTDTVSDTVRNTPLGDLLKVRINILAKL